jgi:chromosome segregation ATPase
MDNSIMIQIVMSVMYFASVFYMDTRYTQTYNELNDELREARDIIKDLEDEIVKRDDMIQGHGILLESSEKREIKYQEQVGRLIEEKDKLLEQLVERGDIIRNLEAIITDRQAELESLNEKVSKIAKSATILVEEAETPHLVPV